MGLGPVGHLIAHAWLENATSAVFQLRLQLALKAQQHMAFAALVVGQIAWGVFEHPNADTSEITGAPIGRACLAWMYRPGHGRPVRRPK